VLAARSPTLAFHHAALAAAEALLSSDGTIDAVSAGDWDAPPIAVRRSALARVGLWEDEPEPESCARWWTAARAAQVRIGLVDDPTSR
jgi:hypothetical protein